MELELEQAHQCVTSERGRQGGSLSHPSRDRAVKSKFEYCYFQSAHMTYVCERRGGHQLTLLSYTFPPLALIKASCRNPSRKSRIISPVHIYHMKMSKRIIRWETRWRGYCGAWSRLAQGGPATSTIYVYQPLRHAKKK